MLWQICCQESLQYQFVKQGYVQFSFFGGKLNLKVDMVTLIKVFFGAEYPTISKKSDSSISNYIIQGNHVNL